MGREKGIPIMLPLRQIPESHRGHSQGDANPQIPRTEEARGIPESKGEGDGAE